VREDPKHYECTYIVHPGVAEGEVTSVTEKLLATMRQAGATIISTAELGRRRLAYPIAHERYGTYATVELSLAPHLLPKLNYSLRLVPNVLRSLIVERYAVSAKEQQQLAKARERLSARQREREAGDRTAAPRRRRPAATAAKPKVELKDLDQKLDEILKDDSLGNA
jgi:small subunit ribosomal protein S6